MIESLNRMRTTPNDKIILIRNFYNCIVCSIIIAMGFGFLFFCLLLIANIIDCKKSSVVEKNLSVEEKWISAFDEIRSLVKDFSQSILPAFDRIISQENISSKCSHTLRKLFTDTDEEWVAFSEYLKIS
jgi:hypothetical protein